MFDLRSDKTMGYHLFFEPKGEAYNLLQEHIVKLAEISGGPCFMPHITLLARIPLETENHLITKTNELANTIQSFSVTVGEVGMEDAYYRALYRHIVPEDLVQKAHTTAIELFGMKEARVFLPHLSLLYGNFTEDEKQTFLSSLGTLDDIQLEIDEVHLYQTEGGTHQWKKVFSCPLGQ